MARYCANCGTEVDDTAVFCPTCGQPIDEDAAAEMPAAPAWPDAAPTDARAGDANARDADAVEAPPPERATGDPAAEAAGDRAEEERTSASSRGHAAPAPERPGEAEQRAWQRTREPVDDAPTRVEQRPPDADPSIPPPIPAAPGEAGRAPTDRAATGDRPAAAGSESAGPQIDLPLTMPVTLSGWLIGIGALLAVLGLIIILIAASLNAIDLLLLVALLGVAATVFLSAQMPAIPHLRLICLIVALIAFGVALDRVAFTGGGAGELLLFLGSAAAAIGAVILELGQDQPLGKPQR